MDITMMDEQLLEKAFIELRKSRLHHCAHVSIWDFSHHWRTLKPQILKKLQMRTYPFSPTRAYCIEGKCLSVCEASDAVVLKQLIQIPNGHHLKGHGGIKALHQVKSNRHSAPYFRNKFS